jgi:hypothetical protein
MTERLDYRAQALLTVGADRIAAWEDRARESEQAGETEPKKVADRFEFVHLLAVVRRLADRRPIYEHVDGRDYIMRGIRSGAWTDEPDPRVVGLARFAVIVKVSEAAIAAEAKRIAADHERGLALADAYMAGLPKPRVANTLPIVPVLVVFTVAEVAQDERGTRDEPDWVPDEFGGMAEAV